MIFDSKKLSSYPTAPGVYMMKARSGRVLYIGKAKNLRQRLRHYFLKRGDGRYMIPFLVEKVVAIDVVVLSSEKEALLLESNLIKEHQPPYNVLLKDDKSFIAIQLKEHPWPRLAIVRHRGQPEKKASYFGPYAHAGAARATLDLVHKLFRLRQCSDQEFARRTRPCILYEIGRCTAPCVRKCTKAEYADQVKEAVSFLRGGVGPVLHKLEAERKHLSDQLAFERAGAIHKVVLQIRETMEPQYVDRPLGIDADLFGLFRRADELVIAGLAFRGGRLVRSWNENFSTIAQEDGAVMSTFLLQYYANKEEIPRQILLSCPVDDRRLLEELLGEKVGHLVQITLPKRGERRRLVEMADANAEAAFTRSRDERALLEKSLLQLQEKLHLTNYPSSVECLDNSNLGGDEPVSALVVFREGKPDKKHYRTYRIKQAKASDDYGALFEVLMRRYARAKKEGELPDLLLIDGGKGHLHVALRAFEQLNIISVNVVAIAKERGRHDKGVTREQLYLQGRKDPIVLPPHSPILFFLQRVRDEAHRFALQFQRKRRKKQLIQSALDSVAGIGPIKKKRLLAQFGSVKQIQKATDEELLAVEGVNLRDVAALRSKLS